MHVFCVFRSQMSAAVQPDESPTEKFFAQVKVESAKMHAITEEKGGDVCDQAYRAYLVAKRIYRLGQAFAKNNKPPAS